MSRSRILFASMSFLLAVACTSGQEELTPAAANWRIDSVPLVAIGDNEADSVPLIGFAIGVTAIGDSQLLVVDRDYHRLTFFDTDGRLVRTVGREGDGPGEFRFLARFARCGDSLVVQDIERDSWLVIGQDGEVARQFKPATPGNARFGTPYVWTCNQAGAFLYGGWDSLPHVDRPTRARGAVPYWLTDRSGKLTVELGNWPGSERLLMPGGSGPHPLGKQPAIALGQGRVYIGTADSFAIQTFNLDGTPGPTVSKPSVELQTTPEDIAYSRLMDTLGQSQDRKEHYIWQWTQFEYPPTVPAYTDLVVDSDDNLWVREFPRGGADRVRWIVFDPRGNEIGSVYLPVTLEVNEIGPTTVLGIETRLDDGAQEVRMYRLYRE